MSSVRHNKMPTSSILWESLFGFRKILVLAATVGKVLFVMKLILRLPKPKGKNDLRHKSQSHATLENTRRAA